MVMAAIAAREALTTRGVNGAYVSTPTVICVGVVGRVGRWESALHAPHASSTLAADMTRDGNEMSTSMDVATTFDA